jgi:hypothetical protein
MVTIRWRVIQTPIIQYNSMSSWANVIRVKLWAYAETPSPHVLRRPGSGDVGRFVLSYYTYLHYFSRSLGVCMGVRSVERRPRAVASE